MIKKISIALLLCICTVSLRAQTPEEDVAIGMQLMKENRPDSAFQHFLSAAERGSKEAMFIVGNMYTLGEGTKKNDAEADFWFARAAHRGFGKAYPYLAQIHLKNHQKDSAVYYLEQVLEYDPTVPAMLGKIYIDDEPRLAFKYFKMGAEAGDPIAMYHLGEMYYDGDAVEFNERFAVYWMQQAAKRNYKPAQEYLEDLGYDDLEEVSLTDDRPYKSSKKKKKKNEDETEDDE